MEILFKETVCNNSLGANADALTLMRSISLFASIPPLQAIFIAFANSQVSVTITNFPTTISTRTGNAVSRHGSISQAAKREDEMPVLKRPLASLLAQSNSSDLPFAAQL